VAVDPDPDALAPLRAAIDKLTLGDRFTIRQAPFESVSDTADVVFFEFCLHEMDDPDAVLRHARTLAPETLIIDPTPDSPWTWHCAEVDKAARSWAAIERAGMRAAEVFVGRQLFPDVDALVARLASLGEPAVSRARAGKRHRNRHRNDLSRGAAVAPRGRDGGDLPALSIVCP
jgi:SAM-dependent methyltransferase